VAGQLAGKVVLVTGGSSGIGRVTALRFAREGAKVVIASRRAEAGQETVHLIKERQGEALFVRTDVSQAPEVAALVTQTVGAYGRLDYAVNNAGVEGRYGVPTAAYPEEDWDRTLAINLKGVWLCLKYEIAQMLQQGGGAVVNMASVAGLVGSAFLGAAYTASKHAVVGLTKTAALEYAQAGIRINAVCPGVIRTPMVAHFLGAHPQLEAPLTARHPVGRLGTPEEVAEAVLWLCSEAASFVTGYALAVDGGVVAQ
jgi:NAD(P)-dependent dehydrogenase (short-subunit alcohol dehydrogenase family)